VFEIKSAILTDWRDGSFSCADFDSFGKSPITQVALGTKLTPRSAEALGEQLRADACQASLTLACGYDKFA
jgi:hypothetical protein